MSWPKTIWSKLVSRFVLSIAVAAVMLVPQAQSQTSSAPKTENAKVEQRAVVGSFTQTVDTWARSADHAQWLAYSVPAVSGDRQVCCGNWNGNNGNCGPCQLEGSDHGNSINLRDDKVKLEGPQSLIVLLRADTRKIGKIRVVSEECTIDAGGLQVIWLTGVNPTESVRYLETIVDSKELDERGGDRLEPRSLDRACIDRRSVRGQSDRQFHGTRQAGRTAQRSFILGWRSAWRSRVYITEAYGQERSQPRSARSRHLRAFHQPGK
jgi:hypothetical protein